MTTTVTERGQVSVPSRLRKRSGLRKGQHLRWIEVSETEFRVVVETPGDAPGPLAALGWAKRFVQGRVPGSDEALRMLRDGDET